MSIVKKSALQQYVTALEKRYEELILLVKGEAPNPNIYNLYHNNPEQYKDEFREINELEIKLAANNFDGILKELRKLNSIKAPRQLQND